MEYEMYISIVGFGISNDADLINIEFVSGTIYNGRNNWIFSVVFGVTLPVLERPFVTTISK